MAFVVSGSKELGLLQALGKELAQAQDSFAEPLHGEFFGLCYNAVGRAFEGAYYLHVACCRPDLFLSAEELQRYRARDPEEVRQENGMKLTAVFRQLFVEIMSGLEFHTRNLVRELPEEHPLRAHVGRKEKLIEVFDAAFEHLGADSKQVLRSVRRVVKSVPPFDSFSKLRESSEKNGFLTAADDELMQFATEARNVTVHNNTIGSRARTMVFDDGSTLEIRAGKPMFGTPVALILLCRDVARCARRWFVALL